MAADGVHHQNDLFYCSHWTREIEKCFVDSLLVHHRNGTFHRDRINCHAVLCAAFDINATFGCELSYSYCQRRLTKLKIHHRVFRWITTLDAVQWNPKDGAIVADDYIWEQITKAREIGKAYVMTPEPHWSALSVLFGDECSDGALEDEHEFFDRNGTCVDDRWVHDIPPHEEYSDSYSSWISHDNSSRDPSWCAFVKEYYASDSDLGSVNMTTNHERRSPVDLCQSPPVVGIQTSVNTPSSCASNDLEGNVASPSPCSKASGRASTLCKK